MPTDQPLPSPMPPSGDGKPDPLHHQHYVAWVARSFRDCGIEREDLLQCGQLGLLVACERFDPARHRKFSTYARYWIREAILLAIKNQCRPVRVPIYLRAWIRKGLTPDSPGLSEDQRECLRAAYVVLGGECGSDVAGLAGRDEPDGVDGPSYEEDVAPYLHFLTERERRIVGLYFGLDGSPPMPYRQIARELGLSTERIAQLYRGALAKLRRAIARD